MTAALLTTTTQVSAGAQGTATAPVTVSQPASVERIRPAADYATQNFQDPWDMSQRTDLGGTAWAWTNRHPTWTNCALKAAKCWPGPGTRIPTSG